jgi:hypothetical protein
METTSAKDYLLIARVIKECLFLIELPMISLLSAVIKKELTQFKSSLIW